MSNDFKECTACHGTGGTPIFPCGDCAGFGKVVGELPAVGSFWMHENGAGPYKVLLLANVNSLSEKYPPTVVYQGANGNVWTKPVGNFLDKMWGITRQGYIEEMGDRAVYAWKANPESSSGNQPNFIRQDAEVTASEVWDAGF